MDDIVTAAKNVFGSAQLLDTNKCCKARMWISSTASALTVDEILWVSTHSVDFSGLSRVAFNDQTKRVRSMFS